MRIGDLAPMKSAKVVLGNCEFGFKAPNSRQGERLMFVFLGTTQNPDEFDPSVPLRLMGCLSDTEIESIIQKAKRDAILELRDQFPSMLRKMWSGTEIHEFLTEQSEGVTGEY